MLLLSVILANIFTNLITRLFAKETLDQLSITQVALISSTVTFMIFCYKYTTSNNSELEKNKGGLDKSVGK